MDVVSAVATSSNYASVSDWSPVGESQTKDLKRCQFSTITHMGPAS